MKTRKDQKELIELVLLAKKLPTFTAEVDKAQNEFYLYHISMRDKAQELLDEAQKTHLDMYIHKFNFEYERQQRLIACQSRIINLLLSGKLLELPQEKVLNRKRKSPLK